MKERLGALDGLRGIAILQVLWFHLWVLRGITAPVSWLRFIPQTGNFGVHLFFFLSGFVIVYPFVRAHAFGEATPRWPHFAYRRFIKIVPSYALSIAVAYAVGFAVIERSHSTVLQELVTHALFIHTWWTATATSINGVLWTLAIEVQFYALYPLVWWCFKKWPWPTGLGLIAMPLGLRLWGAAYLSPGVINVLAGNLPNFIDLFACGMLCAWCFVYFTRRHQQRTDRYVMPAIATTGVAVIVATFVSLSNAHALYPRAYLHEVLGIAFGLVAFGALLSRGWNASLSNPVLRFFAVISYNLYLYNWMVMHEFAPPPSAAFVVTTIGASILIATLVTYLLERPLLRLPDPGSRRGPYKPEVTAQFPATAAVGDKRAT